MACVDLADSDPARPRLDPDQMSTPRPALRRHLAVVRAALVGEGFRASSARSTCRPRCAPALGVETDPTSFSGPANSCHAHRGPTRRSGCCCPATWSPAAPTPGMVVEIINPQPVVEVTDNPDMQPSPSRSATSWPRPRRGRSAPPGRCDTSWCALSADRPRNPRISGLLVSRPLLPRRDPLEVMGPETSCSRVGDRLASDGCSATYRAYGNTVVPVALAAEVAAPAWARGAVALRPLGSDE